MGKRRSARELALKFLYQQEFNSAERDERLREFLDDSDAHDSVKDYARTLLSLVFGRMAEIDAQLQRCSENWALHRMTVIDRSILRIGACELLYRKNDVPPKAAIDEAVELAKTFGNEDSPQFVNGVLDRLKKEIDGAVAVP